MSSVHKLSHPLIQHKLSLLRDKERSTNGFRSLVREIALLGGDVAKFVHPLVRARLAAKVASLGKA